MIDRQELESLVEFKTEEKRNAKDKALSAEEMAYDMAKDLLKKMSRILIGTLDGIILNNVEIFVNYNNDKITLFFVPNDITPFTPNEARKIVLELTPTNSIFPFEPRIMVKHFYSYRCSFIEKEFHYSVENCNDAVCLIISELVSDGVEFEEE